MCAVFPNPVSTSSSFFWKMSAATESPKGRRSHRYRPLGVPKVVRWLDSSWSTTCQYPLFTSTTVNTFALFRQGKISSIVVIGYGLRTNALFRNKGSMHTQSEPSFFSAMTKLETHWAWKGVLWTAKKKGWEEARGFTTVRGAPQNGDGRFRDHAPDGSAALQNLYFFKRGAKNILENAENAQKKRATRNRLVHGLPWRCGGRLGVQMSAQGEYEPQTGQKTSTASKATLSICRMRTKVVASSPICKSSVVDLVMSRDHQNDNAVWPCRFTKKKWSIFKKGTEQSAFEPTTTRSKFSGLPPRPSGNRRMHAKKLGLNHVSDRHGVLESRSGKGVFCAFD